MFVRYWMTRDPITIGPGESVLSAMDVMRVKKVRRLPIVENGQLVGIISLSDVRHFISPGQERRAALPPGVEENAAQIPAATVMIRSIISCTPDTFLEDLGELMKRHRIGAVPVVQQGQLVGIITETDFLKAMAALAHLGEGRRVCFRTAVAGKTESFYGLVALCKSHNLELLTLSTQPIENGAHHLVLMRVRGEKVDAFIDSLWKSHHNVMLAE